MHFKYLLLHHLRYHSVLQDLPLQAQLKLKMYRFRLKMGNYIFPVTVMFSFMSRAACDKAPNIVIIVADDLGWNDVGFHGSNQGSN